MGWFSNDDDGATPFRKFDKDTQQRVKQAQARHKEALAARKRDQRAAAKSVKERDRENAKNPPAWW